MPTSVPSLVLGENELFRTADLVEPALLTEVRLRPVHIAGTLGAERRGGVLADELLDPCTRVSDLHVRLPRLVGVGVGVGVGSGVGVGVGFNISVGVGRADGPCKPLESEVVAVVRGREGATAIRTLRLPLRPQLGPVGHVDDRLGYSLGFLQRLQRALFVAVAFELHGSALELVLLLPQHGKGRARVFFVGLPTRLLAQLLQKGLVVEVVFGKPHIR
jgi:hypothetical protein